MANPVELAGLLAKDITNGVGTLAGVSSIVQPITSMLGTAGSIAGNLIGINSTNESNAQMMAETNKYNADLWREQSQYNSPVEQMKRLKMAGINPSLIYGQGGIENLAGAPPQMQASRNQAYTIDPLTLAQVQNLNAQTESIEHQTQREDEKQPMSIEQLQATLDETRARTDEFIQKVKNLKMDEQIASYDYLAKSLDYNFRQATFADAVSSIHQGLLQSKLDFDVTKFGLDKALKQLSYEVVGWDLSNEAQRSAISLSKQEYRQNEVLFDSIKRKYFWESQNAWATYNKSNAETKKIKAEQALAESELPLKELSFWINARDNIGAFREFRHYHPELGFRPFDGAFSEFMSGFADTYNHGIGLPLKLKF